MRIKLRTKFIASIVAIVLIFGSINLYLIRKNVIKSLEKEIDKRGLYIAQTLSRSSVQMLLFEDYVNLQKLVDFAVLRKYDIAYSFIEDRFGNVVVHSFEEGFPTELSSLNIFKSLNISMERRTSDDERVLLISDGSNLYRDILYPIMNGELGFVRVGILENKITAQVSSVLKVFLWMVGLFTAAGIAGAFIFSNLITEPISKIVEISETLDLNKPIPDIKIRTGDELEYLGEKFHQMISRLKAAQDNLKETHSNMAHTEKLASIGTITSGLVHEINNPLSGLKNCVRRIKKNPENINQINRYMPLMENALNKIEIALNRLLDFSRRHDLDFKVISINKILDNVEKLMEYRIKRNKIGLIKNYDKHLPLIWADEHQLEQVFINIVINAVDAMPDGGELKVETGQKNGFIRVKISDSGCGIGRKDLNRVFDPFFTTKNPGKGTGLGLTVSRDIIKLHKGDIHIASSLKKGTKLTVTLPSIDRNWKNETSPDGHN